MDGGREKEARERDREKTNKRGERRCESVRMSKRDRRRDEVRNKEVVYERPINQKKEE